MFQKAVSRYTAPTPVRFIIWGDIILGIGTMLQVTLQAYDDIDKGWTIGVALLTAFGAALPKFARFYEPVENEADIQP